MAARRGDGVEREWHVANDFFRYRGIVDESSENTLKKETENV